MAITKPTYATNVIGVLGTTSQERGLTADEFKAKFDKTGQDNKMYTENTLIPEIEQVKLVSVNASKALALDDRYTVQACSHAADLINITIPPNSAAAFPVGTQIAVSRDGAGEVAVVAGAGVTILSVDNKLKLSKQNSTAALLKKAADVWQLTGQLKL